MCTDNNVDAISRYNRERWDALVEANALFTRPYFDLDAEAARQRIDPEDMLGDLQDKAVLLLAGGGGQQSAAFGLLGAQVTVVDLSAGQLARDREAAAHHGLDIRTQQGDMRDLSVLDASSFDLVYHPYALNFVPDAGAVFAQVARVLRPGGMYYVMCANPFASGLTEASWNGQGYGVTRPYVQGQEVSYYDSDWVYDRSAGGAIQGPREFLHTLSSLLNAMIALGFVLRRFEEIAAESASIDAEAGSWDHFTAIMPPWLAFWTMYRPDLAFRAEGQSGQ
jgi:ubiquinone/menaquinone biosynthesis C-methylase UbiE